ncbi:response regulator [Cohnella fermenti]|uniref:Response regulator n=1 Tax=Cohnella fermenti TaxID=2565925 RepID=A0A4V3WET6_9BACL|nr:response regulator [Cohnella fermenti]THF77563.1 response regulator [Cohnella fermenti]
MGYEIILIDDEQIIRKGLAKLIAEHTVGWKVVAEARNGEEGLKRIEELRPSLAIVDIRMPLLSGIEVAKEVQRLGLPTRIVILTGYKDFEYARSALKYGVMDFLLKPCPEEEVIRTLDECYRTVDKEHRQRRLNEQLREEALLRQVILGIPPEPAERQALETRIVGWLCGFLTGLDGMASKFDGETALLHFAVRNIAEELAEGSGDRLQMVFIGRHAAALLVDSKGKIDSEENGSMAPEWLKRLPGTLDQLLGAAPKLAVPGPVRRLEQLPSLAAETLRDEARASGSPQGGEAPGEPGELNDLLQHSQLLVDDWSYLVEEGKLVSLKAQVAEEIGRLETEALPPQVVRNRVSLLSIVLDKLCRRILNAELELPAERYAPSGSKDEMLAVLRQASGQFFDRLETWQRDNNRDTIKRVIAFVEERYSESCSLSDAAAFVHFNPTYLSTIFKKETGEGFVNYVTKRRMSQARLLLANTDLKIAEVAAKVGYDDPNYFTTLFRKTCGCAPNQFRKGESGV